MKNKIIMKSYYVLGDTHSLSKITELIIAHNLKDFVLIGCGDHGEGFGVQEVDERKLWYLNNECEERYGEVYLVRGNHTDPSWYKEDKFPQFQKIKFVPDYSLLNFEGRKFLFVGGAVSVDRSLRLARLKEFGIKSWWVDEGFVFDKDKAQECDFLITHSSGKDEFPRHGKESIRNWFYVDSELDVDCDKERDDIQKLVDICKPKYHIFGHFHKSNIEYIGNPQYLSRCLAIDEILEITNLIYDNR